MVGKDSFKFQVPGFEFQVSGLGIVFEARFTAAETCNETLKLETWNSKPGT
jgi:hypothetical protein